MSTIPQELDDRPEVRYLKRHVEESVCAAGPQKWFKLGVELLQEKDVEALEAIKHSNPELTERCSEMFKLWLNRQPEANWRNLIDALKHIDQNKLAFDVENLLSVRLTNEETDTVNQTLTADQLMLRQHHGDTGQVPSEPTLLTLDQLKTEFSHLLMRIRHILSQSSDRDRNLEACKEFCSYLKASGNANAPLFSKEMKSAIDNCRDFRQFFDIISQHISWDEPFILSEIIDECGSVEAEEEFKKYKRKMAVSKALEIISSIESNPPPGFERFIVIIDKPYRKLTVDKYEEIKKFIFDNLDINSYVATGYIRVLFDSLHLEWHVTTQATPHMIKMAIEQREVFTKNCYVFIQIGKEIIIDVRTEQTVELTNERESELEAMRKDLVNKDAEIEQNTATIQWQNTEIERLQGEIRKKNQEIERRGIQITEQQITNNELEEKLPSRDVMQLSEKSTNYWEWLKTTWSKVADLPVKLMSCCAVEMDGDVYISGRSQSTHFINVLHYSQADNSWSILNHLPCTHFSLAVVRSKSQLIAVGGIYPDVGDEINFEEDIPSKLSGKVLTWDAQMECWVNAYPDMPTARCSFTAVGHGSTVIVAGGVTGWEPTVTSTSVVEVMTVNEIPLRSEWTTVQSLPYPSSFALPMIIGDQLYIASGYSGDKTTCGVLTANVSKLVTSKKDDTIFVWKKMSDLPHDSLSVGECEGCLVVFGGRRKSGTLEDGQLQYKLVSPIHLYNAEMDTWDYVGHVPKEYCYWLGCAVCLEQNKLLFVGGAYDPNEGSHDAYLSTCALLTITTS